MKLAGTEVKTAGALPEQGASFPEFSLTASDDRVVSDADFDGRKKVFFFCHGPLHSGGAWDDVVVDFIKAAAAVLDDDAVRARAGDVTLVPVARATPADWRYLLNASGVFGVAPLSVGEDVAVPFPVFVAGDRKGALAAALVYVDDNDVVVKAQVADDAATLAGLDVGRLLA